MKVSTSWLKDFIPLELPPEELATHLLLLGFEVEDTLRIGPDFRGVVVGEVLKVEKHPNADRLSLCEVSDGSGKYAVVCGAPNVAAGQRVPFARVGAELSGGLKIKKSKIRGVVSQGMICSQAELGLADEADGIMVLSEGSSLGADFRDLAGEPDVVLDLDIKPNRPDCLSHLGLARELAVYFDLPLTRPKADPFEENGPAPMPVSVESGAECPRYLGRLIEGVRVGPSPAWLARRLEAVGLRPINNVVDITNYVLMETGQPLHAFDADLLEGGKIVVRDAREGEKIRALDDKEYSLKPESLVIADAARPVAVAGVIGGEDTAVTGKTRRVFLEVANFRPGRVRRSGSLLGVRTDSRHRFERGADIGGVPAGAARATSLILSLAGGKAGPVSDTNPDPPARAAVSSSAERLNRILGTDHPPERIEGVLRRLSERFEGGAGGFSLHPPSYRHDIGTAWDLAEEVGRHLSYDSIPDEAGAVRLLEPETLPLEDCRAALSDTLCGLGFSEAYNYDFVSMAELERFLGLAPHHGPNAAPEGAGHGAPPEGDTPADELAQSTPDTAKYARVSNPISEDWALLRPTLLIGLLRNAALNFNRGAPGVRLFEFGRTYRLEGGAVAERPTLAGLLAGPYPLRAHWKSKGEDPDFYDVKGALDALLGAYRVSWGEPSAQAGPFHPKAHLELLAGKAVCGVESGGPPCPPPSGGALGARCGRAGLLHPDLVKRWDLASPGDRGAARNVAVFELDLEALLAAKREAARFSAYSAFPSSARDISILVPEETPFGRLASTLRGLGLDELERIELIDLFTGKGVPAGKKSWTVRLTFSRSDRTLRDAEVQAAVDKALNALRAECGAALRG